MPPLRNLPWAVWGALLLTVGCSGGGDNVSDPVVAQWCAQVEAMDQYDDALTRPGSVSEAEREEAQEFARDFFATPAPPEVQAPLGVIREGPPDGREETLNAAAAALADFVRENCDGVDADIFEAAP